MAVVGMIVHLGRASASAQARELAEGLIADGHVVRAPHEDAETAGLDGVEVRDGADFADGLDLVVALGGDGSMLRAIELVGSGGTPIMGVDHGQLGYLTEVEPAEAADAVARFLAGERAVEERMLLAITVDPGDGSAPIELVALNEAVVERSADVNTIRLQVDIDGEFFTTYAVDGMIIATPTGSTAYAFSVRGRSCPHPPLHARDSGVAPHAFRPIAGPRALEPGRVDRRRAPSSDRVSGRP